MVPGIVPYIFLFILEIIYKNYNLMVLFISELHINILRS